MNKDIIIKGARENNLKDISLKIPRDKLVVMTGLSGSGKSSLAFETIYAEGQRRYVESLSAYARQFLGQMDKPDVDVIEGLTAMATWCDGARKAGDCAGGLSELRDDWFQLFAGPGEPAAPAWAGYYMATNSQILSEESLAVRHIYVRHGFEPARKNREPDDDLGIMLGFLGQLAGEAATAESSGNADEFRARKDARELLERHILPWIGVWRDRVVTKAHTSFYRGVGIFVFGLVHSYAEGLGVKAAR